MSKSENILIILTPGFPESEADSTCLPMQQNLARTIQATHPLLNILILSLQYPYFEKTYIWQGITVMSFNGRNKGGLTRFLLRKKINTVLHEIHLKNKIIGLLSFWCGECAFIGKRFADKHQLSHFCWILGQDAKKDNKYVRRIRPKPGELIALSDFIQEEFERNHRIRPAHIITPGINTQQFNPLNKEKDIDILAAGSLISLKQYDVFIEVVAALRKEMPGIKTILAGDGPEKKSLQKIIAQYGLESTIRLTGELPYPEVLALMQRTKVFLHPSSYEGFGMVCLEALYGGANVVSFVKPVKKEISGWYPVKSKEEMVQKTYGLLASTGTLMGRANCFTIETTAKKMMGLFPEGSQYRFSDFL